MLGSTLKQIDRMREQLQDRLQGLGRTFGTSRKCQNESFLSGTRQGSGKRSELSLLETPQSHQLSQAGDLLFKKWLDGFRRHVTRA